MPKVSVIVPNYNHAAYLPQRLESILRQSFQDFELLLLDDHSNDNSVPILHSYAHDPRVAHVEVNAENSGSTFVQWEKGLALARGEYIWLAESDDVAHPDFLAQLVKVLDTRPWVGVAFAASYWMDAEGNEMHKPDHEAEDAEWRGKDLLHGPFLQGPVIYNASAAVFRKELTSKVNFTELRKFRYTGDWLFWVQVAADVSVARLGQRLNGFRRHAGNVSSQADKAGLLFTEGFRVIRYIYTHFQVPFWMRRANALRWARRLPRGSMPAGVPQEVRFYHFIYRLFT